MIGFLGDVLSSIFGSNSWLATLIVSMFPIIEVKGAIPLGMSVEFWGSNALGENEAFLFSLIGSCLVVPIIALIFKPIIKYMKGTRAFQKVALTIENKVNKSKEKIVKNVDETTCKKRKSIILKMLGVFLFVAIPLPLTGVWTGTCVAVCLGLAFWQIVVSCVLGNIVAGLLIMFVCSLFPNFTTVVFLIIVLIVLVALMGTIIKSLIKKKT